MSTKRRGFWQRRIERSTPFPFDRGGGRRPSGILGRNERFGRQECHPTADASLGLSAGRSASQGNDDSQRWVPTTSMTTSRILTATAHWATVPSTFDCDGASGDQPVGLVTKGTSTHRHPRTERTVRWARIPPPRRRTFLLASRPDKIPRGGVYCYGDVEIPGDGASGDCTLGPSAGRHVSTQASPGATPGSVDGRDAPSTIAMDVGPAADGHRRQRTTLALLMRVCLTPTAPQQDNRPAFTSSSREEY